MAERVLRRKGSTGFSPTSFASALTIIAGDISGAGAVDGAGANARFSRPSGVTVDANGNVYVSDYKNRTIRKVTSAGVVTTLAGTAGISGSADGSGAAARFGGPIGITVDAVGNLYVADTDNSIIRKITPAGVVTTLAGTAGVVGSADRKAAAQFRGPFGVTLDGTGNLYVADTFNGTIRKITPAGAVTTVAGTAGTSGTADGTGAAAQFNEPQSIVVNAVGDLYVTDSLNHTIRKITPAGVVSTLAGTAGAPGSADGVGVAAQFNFPSGITIDRAGNLYVADSDNQTIRKLTPAGVVTTVAGTPGLVGSTDDIGAAARFRSPADVTADAAGNLYVADLSNRTIRKITPAGVVSTLAGPVQPSGSADGIGTAARFNGPTRMTRDAAGNLYVADTFNNAIRKITPAGAVTTLAGSAEEPGSADGIGAAAHFNRPSGITSEVVGNLYVADTGNHTIRKITPAGQVATLAGTAGMPGIADGTGAAARFDRPAGMTADVAGNVYVADSFNHTIRKITPAGAVTTIAGAAGLSGDSDGTGTQARFDTPQAVELDAAGNLYVADARAIRKIAPGGVVSTLAGNPRVAGSADGVGLDAQFDLPVSIAIDGAGNLYVVDFNNNTLRKVTPAGVVTTVAGVAGEDNASVRGSIGAPFGVAFIDPNTLALTTRNAVMALNPLLFMKSG